MIKPFGPGSGDQSQCQSLQRGGCAGGAFQFAKYAFHMRTNRARTDVQQPCYLLVAGATTDFQQDAALASRK